jgi:effector-binding domain-containing protein/uncharacterized protein YndB with AHSA1/START domain
MKVVKMLGVLVLVVIAIVMILMLILPTRQVVTKSIMINAAPADVYEYLSKLDNFNKWAIWNNSDSTTRHNITGKDGTPGATSTWLGENAGEGKIEITSLEINQEIEHKITFIQPKHRNAKSEFDLEPMAGNRTKVTWTFEIATPRPGNIFNLLSNLEARMGSAFEDGLKNLKAALESSNTASASKTVAYEIEQLNFPGAEYAVYRQDKVNWMDIPVFFSQYRPRVLDEATKANGNPKTATGLFYSWDDLNQQTDVAAAFEINSTITMANDSFSVVSLPASKAIYIDYYGDPSKTQEAYKQIDEYVKTNELKKKSPVIEQYLSGTDGNTDMSKWKTRIILLVD